MTTTHPSAPADLFRCLEEHARFQTLARLVAEPSTTGVVEGLLSSGAKALLLAELAKLSQKPIAYISPESELESLADEIRFFYDLVSNQQPTTNNQQRSFMTVPAFDVDPYRGVSPHAATLEARAHALYQLSQGQVQIVLVPVKSLLTRTINPSEMSRLGCQLRVGDAAPFEELTGVLRRVGYRQEDPVTTVGEFSLRGGILDVFTPAHPNPVRIEFFGDQVESLRAFDPETQRSLARLEQVAIVPMSEIVYEPDDLRRWAEAAAARWTEPLFRRDLRIKYEFAEAGEAFQGWEFQMPLVRALDGTLFDYLQDALLVVDEPALVSGEAGSFLSRMRAHYEESCEAGEVALEPAAFFLTLDQAMARLRSSSRIELCLMPDAESQELDDYATGNRQHATRVPTIELPSQAVPRFHGRIPEAVEQINRWHEEHKTILLVARSKGMAERLGEMLREYDVPPIAMVVGKLAKGFVLPWAQLCVIAEGDVLEEDRLDEIGAPAASRSRAKMSAFLSDFRDLKPGDFVVHIDHGIGQFQGLAQLTTDGRGVDVREFLLLEYAEGAKLYVPVERLDLVQKYSSADSATPSLDRLGGATWERTKSRVRRALRDMSEELLKLYAERSLARGFAYSADSPWQSDFDSGFEYELTPDQDTAIADIKRDMEQPLPMDRLLCGDVGFGKTEVAMRAAFKSVMDSKQVAVLAPTTVLAYQHFQTFQQRFAAFPIKVELLSRFRSRQEQKKIISELAEGAVDILIGTHRLLGKDIQFRDLGLVVIDEEQRFGVVHKERLKQLRRKVDVLTLSATPIPRTLHMSLMGLKPMSVIETPPRDRLAIQTILAPFSNAVIKTAIERELERDGQVFFVHNRIESIYTLADTVRRLVPHAPIGVTHAEMSPRELERVMMKFVRHELDVLVSTTIIENGIDIPLANTIIINHAERFGLSELYQLRGRVGRSNRRAYAYLLIPDERSLTPVARRRLAAIKEFSDLGAGFRLAALDLELRGAGNLLGAEQSGHIRAIGFDLYCQMLERTIREIKGETIEEDVNTQMDLGVDVRIPEEYISDMGQRLRIYKRVSSAPDERKLQEIRDELLDRYGPAPESVENLLEYARLRREAVTMRVLSIDRQREFVHIKFDPGAHLKPEKLIELVAAEPQTSFSPTGILKVKLSGRGRQLLAEVRNLLMRLR
jgi:transcription-repair coupling factor (superfamily II helicase)